eukprot:CAMPEP_0171060374 /NCGR_PEP_ID=MMETSP0766_2-20121228/3798_1 /TAXON_ID=439317 /ORGANISM="Gambierdiscus australes, Strain CAWD 149" /LENGTH=269 /DNA_ID=CAMNT_0011515947 /DNA_START=115 /DNA_END=924 /DNA_ORIENTATION=-
MPPHAAANPRPKLFHGVIGTGLKPLHGHCLEYLLTLVAVANNLGFLVGSIFFYSRMPTALLETGCFIFIICGIVQVLLSLHALAEARAFTLSGLDDMLHLVGMEHRKLRNEFLEQLCFLVAGVVFCVGTFFFMPGAYGRNATAAYHGHEVGARLFVAGSFGFVLASFFNAVQMSADPDHQNLRLSSVKMHCHYVHAMGLAISQVGSVCFVVGSVLYRPMFEHTSGADDLGTNYYVAGSSLYVVESILSFYVLVLRESAYNDPAQQLDCQ